MRGVGLFCVGLVGCYQPVYEGLACGDANACPSGLRCNRDRICTSALDDARILVDAPIDMPPDMPDANLDLIEFTMRLRDFRRADIAGGHPDFETATQYPPATGLVQPTLVGGKPVLTTGTHPGIQSAASFDQWYRDVSGVNSPIDQPIALNRTNNSFSYGSTSFFPLDNAGWVGAGTEPSIMGHNFAFTTESHIAFTYQQQGERIVFTGDDDVWIFVDDTLVIDLGGVHGPLTGSITIDPAMAANLGLVVGRRATISIFQAERHITGSSYQLTLENVTP